MRPMLLRHLAGPELAECKWADPRMQINVDGAACEDDIKDMRGCLSLQLSFHTSVRAGGGVNGSRTLLPPPRSI